MIHLPLFKIRLIIFMLLLMSCQQVKEADPKGKVIGISDGDTIKILIDGKTFKVRLFGIDSPERSQAFGTKAKDFASSLAFGKEVSLIIHGKDRYKRILAEVILPNGKNLNEELVKNGYAWHYTKYSDSRRLEKFEKDARKKRKGLWQDESPLPPWEFRALKRKQSSVLNHQLYGLIYGKGKKNCPDRFIHIEAA